MIWQSCGKFEIDEIKKVKKRGEGNWIKKFLEIKKKWSRVNNIITRKTWN